MNTDEIRKLEQTRIKVVRFAIELDHKLEQKTITREEYDKEMDLRFCGRDKEEIISFIDEKIRSIKDMPNKTLSIRDQSIAAGLTLAVIMIIGIISLLSSNNNMLTGYATHAQIQEALEFDQQFKEYGETALNLTNITSLRISGTLEGNGARILLRTENKEYLVASINNNALSNKTTEYSISTDKKEYALGEPVSIKIDPAVEDSSSYIVFQNENSIIDNLTYLPELLGDYKIVTLITTANDIIRLELNFSVINATTAPVEANRAAYAITEQSNITQKTLAFEKICTESCSMPPTSNPTLIIMPDALSTLSISSIIASDGENQAPRQIKTIGNLTLSSGSQITLNLSEYFSEPEGEIMSFDMSLVSGISSSIFLDQLTISSSIPGSYSARTYATDGNLMATSNDFIITVEDSLLQNRTQNDNQTLDDQTSIENIKTEPHPSPAAGNDNLNTSYTAESDDCSDPDPNRRPLLCTQGINSTYFKPEEIIINNKQGSPVAKFTPIGNLLIRGDIVESSMEEPSQQDYQLGFIDDNGDYKPTIWIDSETGSLHLKGSLKEANGNIPASEGLSALANKRGIVLALFNRKTGDMTIRGNIIPFRRSFE